jgi:hypothetical protein
MKYDVDIGGKYWDVSPNSPFINNDFRGDFNNTLRKLKTTHGDYLYRTNFHSSTSYDSFGFEVRHYLDTLFGEGSDGRGNSYFQIYCSITAGKGKKHIGDNTIHLSAYINLASSNGDERYRAVFNNHRDMLKKYEYETPIPTNEISSSLVERIDTLSDTIKEELKKTWIQAHDELVARDVDFMEYPETIKQIFNDYGSDIEIEYTNNLSEATLELRPVDKDMYGRCTINHTDGNWRINSVSYCFGFVDEIFGLESGYGDDGKKIIKDGKLLDVIKIIAEEYAREDKMRTEFKKVRDQYITVTKEEN